MDELFFKIQDMIAHRKIGNTTISAWDIGWHIEHVLVVIIKSARAVEASQPAEYKWKFNFWRSIILASGYIPRGRAKAPKVVAPQGKVSLEELQQALGDARSAVARTKSLSEYSYMMHPYFGQLKRDTALRFFAVHTNHHLKIMDDILSKR